MTTFGLPADSESLASYEYIPTNGASRPVPDVVIEQADSLLLSSNDDSGIATPHPGSDGLDIEDSFNDTAGPDSDYPLIATQPLSQSQHVSYNPNRDQHLVGCLMPATAKCTPFDLSKFKEKGQWTIGRHPTNDLVLPGPRLSNFHCKLLWNGKQGPQSEVKLEDRSTNGTWINHTYVRKGQQSLLRSGAAISFGAAPEAVNDFRYIFRDIEGQSTRHANQIWAKYDMGYELGAGAFARVHKCIERATGIEYAVKIINKSKLNGSRVDEQAVVREISILQRLADFRHKNIVSLHEHFEEEDSIYLILELVRGGDLLTYISKNGPLPEDQVRRMAAQICHAVAYVHSHGITHRDLKPENVLMTSTDPPDCKVADFGLAKLVDQHTFLKTMCGTPAYLAPEVVLRTDPKQAYDCRVDTWSLGVIFYCMLTNCAPFQGIQDPEPDMEAQRRYFGTRKVEWQILDHVHLSEDGKDFLQNMLVEDPRGRKTVAYMLDHHWISHLVPSDSQFQREPEGTPPPSESSATPPTTDGALACSQSMGNLNLSDIPIPGLSMIDQHATKRERVTTASSNAPHQEAKMDSFASDFSVTAKIPGAFPKFKKEKAVRQRLPAVEEAGGADLSWNFVGAPSSSMPGPVIPVKRRSNLITGSSPLSSLSSEDDDEITEESLKNKPATRRGVPPRSKGKAVDTSSHKRRSRPPSSTMKLRSTMPKDDDDRGGKRSGRPPAKTPRYA